MKKLSDRLFNYFIKTVQSPNMVDTGLEYHVDGEMIRMVHRTGEEFQITHRDAGLWFTIVTREGEELGPELALLSNITCLYESVTGMLLRNPKIATIPVFVRIAFDAAWMHLCLETIKHMREELGYQPPSDTEEWKPQ